MSKDTSFRKFFNVDASPKTQINPITGVYDYYPKHAKYIGRLVWNSTQKGTYKRALHGELN